MAPEGINLHSVVLASSGVVTLVLISLSRVSSKSTVSDDVGST